MDIRPGGLDDPRVVRLLQHHVTTAGAQTVQESAHALDLDGLSAPDVDFWTVWDDGQPIGMGAVKRLSGEHFEVKSMHTAASARRRGVGSAMLGHIIAHARARGAKRLSLETGAQDFFTPALALYRRHGFVDCHPFGDYVLDPNSVFLTLELEKDR
jgi:putative acetyltransferase